MPAFQRLFPAHDVFLDHKRRYSLRQVEGVVRAAGLEVVRSRCFFALLLPAAIAFRVMEKHREPRSNLRVHAPLVNRWSCSVWSSRCCTSTSWPACRHSASPAAMTSRNTRWTLPSP